MPNSKEYDTYAKMIRVYVGISTRSTDINPKSTYRVINIEIVSFFFLSFLTRFRIVFYLK